MPAHILVIDSDKQALTESIRLLQGCDFEVTSASDSQVGLAMVSTSEPDLIMVDALLEDQGCEEITRMLRLDPKTRDIPIIATIPAERLSDLMIGTDSYWDEWLLKPFTREDVTLKIEQLIKPSSHSRRNGVVSTGSHELDSKMGGGIPLGSLTLIEGTSGAGKSVLAQQLMWGSLKGGFRLSSFTTENGVKSLVQQMRSLSLDITDFVLLRRLRIIPVEVSGLGKNAPTALLGAMRSETGTDIIVVDSLTALINGCTDPQVLGFFEGAKRICANGTTVLIVLHSYGVTQDLLTRLRSLCDAHLRLSTEEMGQKLVHMLEVTKVRGADRTTGNIVSFDVEPGWGMRLIPVNKVKG